MRERRLSPLPHRFDDATWVGYRLAEILPIPVQARQRLLELDDPISRLEIIQAYLRQHKLLGDD
jgi:Lon protease-like protein